MIAGGTPLGDAFSPSASPLLLPFYFSLSLLCSFLLLIPNHEFRITFFVLLFSPKTSHPSPPADPSASSTPPPVDRLPFHPVQHVHIAPVIRSSSCTSSPLALVARPIRHPPAHQFRRPRHDLRPAVLHLHCAAFRERMVFPVSPALDDPDEPVSQFAFQLGRELHRDHHIRPKALSSQLHIPSPTPVASITIRIGFHVCASPCSAPNTVTCFPPSIPSGTPSGSSVSPSAPPCSCPPPRSSTFVLSLPRSLTSPNRLPPVPCPLPLSPALPHPAPPRRSGTHTSSPLPAPSSPRALPSSAPACPAGNIPACASIVSQKYCVFTSGCCLPSRAPPRPRISRMPARTSAPPPP